MFSHLHINVLFVNIIPRMRDMFVIFINVCFFLFIWRIASDLMLWMIVAF